MTGNTVDCVEHTACAIAQAVCFYIGMLIISIFDLLSTPVLFLNPLFKDVSKVLVVDFVYSTIS